MTDLLMAWGNFMLALAEMFNDMALGSFNRAAERRNRE